MDQPSVMQRFLSARGPLRALGLLFLSAVLATPAAWALGISVGAAARSPSDATDASLESQGVYDGVVALNPLGQTVYSDRGFQSVTRVSVDGSLGLIRGATSLSLDRALDAGSPVTAAASGAFVYAAPLLGSGTAEIPVTVQLAFDGAFRNVTGDPMLILNGTMAAGTRRSGIFSSGLTFWQAPGSPVELEQQGTDEQGNDAANAIPLVLSQTADHLAGVARVSFLARPGEVISFSGLLLGSVTGGVDAQGNWQPSSGTVDFLNTGRLSILLPQGYSLDSEAPLLRNVVQTVPEPGSWALMGAGLALLLGLRRPKRGG